MAPGGALSPKKACKRENVVMSVVMGNAPLGPSCTGTVPRVPVADLEHYQPAQGNRPNAGRGEPCPATVNCQTTARNLSRCRRPSANEYQSYLGL